MTTLVGIVGCVLACLALYALAAGFVCLELNQEMHHWWCPLCQLTRLFARRWTF